MCNKNSNNWNELKNTAFFCYKEKVYRSNTVYVYNVKCKKICCRNFKKIYFFGNCIEKISIQCIDNKIYYSLKIITFCKSCIKIFKKVYIISPKCIC